MLNNLLKVTDLVNGMHKIGTQMFMTPESMHSAIKSILHFKKKYMCHVP